MKKSIKIKKRNGTVETYNPQKFHNKVFFALEGLNTLSASEIEMNAARSIVNGSSSSDIQNALINSCADLITENLPDAEIASARLLNQEIRKKVYGSWTPCSLLTTIDKNIKDNVYDGSYLFDNYTRDEIEEFGNYIDYNRDDDFVYSGLLKTSRSYLAKKYGEIKETPQDMYMMINLFAFAKYPKELRKKWVIEGYNILSKFEASLPTPIMIQLRTMFRKFISCNIIPFGDSKETLANGAKSIYMLVAGGAGLGMGTGDIRGLGGDIDEGRLEHTGLQPLLKSYEKASKAFVQPDRDGSSTNYYPYYHREIETILVIGNNKGTENTRVRDMDHCIVFNDLFFDRYKKGEDITLFYMNDVPDLQSYNGFDEFKEKYEYYERTVPKRKQLKISSAKIFNRFLDERFLQSREYCLFANEFQQHSAFDIPVKTSNLCLEISVPTYPIREISIKRNIIFNNEESRKLYYELRTQIYFHQLEEKEINKINKQLIKLFTFADLNINADVDERQDFDYFTLQGIPNISEIGVCILGGINLGQCKSEKRIKIVSEYLVRFLDELIDYMEYDLPEVEKAAKMRRTLGIGFSDVFHDLAKNKKFYNTKEGRQFLADRVELSSYEMIKTSVQLAKEKGACQLITDTKYSKGIMPIDTYNKHVDELISADLKLDWESLRADLLKYGIRNSTLMANAPYGSSSIVSNSTPGLEPPRDICVSKDGATKLVPDIKTLKNYYTTVWSDEFNNIDYFKFIACAQKFMDQTISTNQYHNLLKTETGKIKKSTLIDETLCARYYGLKSLYYSNIRSTNQKDGTDEEIEENEQKTCSGGGCEV